MRLKLAAWRRFRGMSQREAAQRALIRQQTWSSVEIGRSRPHGSTLLAMAYALGCKVEDLYRTPKE